MKIKLDNWQQAETVPLKDTENYYTSSNVEGALAEIADGTTLDTRYLKLDASNSPITGNLAIGVNGTNTSFTKHGNTVGDEFFVGTTGAFRVQRATSNSEGFRMQVLGDSQGRLLATSDGRLKWGDGSNTQDIVLRRSAALTLLLDGAKLQIKSPALGADVTTWTSSDGSRLGRLLETGGGHGWFEIDNSSGTALFLIRTDGGSSYFNSGNFGIGDIPQANSNKLTIGSGWTFKESTAPAADEDYGKMWTESNNELFFQSGDGKIHLVHGDAFSNLWFHSVTTDTIEISTAAVFTLIDSFENIGEQDDLGNVIANTTNNDITIGTNGAGKYKMTFHISMSSATATSEMVIAMGITFNTPIDVTEATNATPIVVTIVAHGLMNGDMITIAGATTNTGVNGDWMVTSVTDDTFTLVDLAGNNSVGNGVYDVSSGDVTILYPGNLPMHRKVGFGALGVGGSNADHSLVTGDKVKLYVANITSARDLLVAIVNMEISRIGD